MSNPSFKTYFAVRSSILSGDELASSIAASYGEVTNAGQRDLVRGIPRSSSWELHAPPELGDLLDPQIEWLFERIEPLLERIAPLIDVLEGGTIAVLQLVREMKEESSPESNYETDQWGIFFDNSLISMLGRIPASIDIDEYPRME